jgi:hypothetical protein
MSKQEGELKKRIRENEGQHNQPVPSWVIKIWLDEAKKEIFDEIGTFAYTEPYDYSLPVLRLKYEEAAKKLISTINKLVKWFGSEVI